MAQHGSHPLTGRMLAAAVAVTAGFVVATTAVVLCAEPPAPAPLRSYSPDEILVMVAEDLATLSPADAEYARYLSLRAGATAEECDELARLATAQVHDLSRRPGIFPLLDAGDRKLAAGTLGTVRVNEVLLRINTTYFGDVFARQWERLGKQEPYWHGDDLRPTEGYKNVEYGHYTDSNGIDYPPPRRNKNDRWTTTEIRKEPTDKVARLEHGFFVRTVAGKAAFQAIQERMVDPRTRAYGTDVPVVDADWFLGQTMVDYKRDPGYHDFLGFNDLKEWERVVGLVRDPKAIDEAFLTELREAVARKGGAGEVTQEDVLRRIVHFDKPGGDVWFTQDANQREADFDPKANPLSELGDDYKFQAIEALGHLRNGFVAKGLFDNKGARQDRAPDFIAADSTAPFADRRVHTGLCMRCHVTGFQPLKMWIRDVFNYKPNFLATKDEKKRRALQEQYVTERLEPYLESSRVRYANAMKAATGWTPEEYSTALAKTWKRHIEGPVTLQMAARRLGVTEKQFQDALTAKAVQDRLTAEGKPPKEVAAAVAVVTTKMDPLLVVYRPGADETTLPAVVFQGSFQRAADVCHGVVRPFAVTAREK